MPALETLDLSKNFINELGANLFQNMKKLEKLDLSSQKPDSPASFNERSFAPLTELKILNMSNFIHGADRMDLDNKIFISNKELQVVDLSGNKLHEVPFALRNRPSITTLIMNDNWMTSLRQSDFIFLHNLEHLEVSLCPNLTRVDDGAFTDLINLRYLIMSSNPMFAYFSKEAFGSSRWPKKEKKLNIIDLSFNNISSLADPNDFPGLASFKKLKLDGNPWHCSCDLGWTRSVDLCKRTLMHCKTPYTYKDIEVSQFFSNVDCDLDESEYNKLVLGIFLISIVFITIAVFVQKTDLCGRLKRNDQYGAIYYTKATETT